MSIIENSLQFGSRGRATVVSRAFDLFRGSAGVAVEEPARPAAAEEDLLDLSDLIGYEVHVLGDTGRSLLSAATVAERAARSLTVDDNVRRGLNRVGRKTPAPTLCLVDIDGTENLAEAVDVLAAFRRSHPDVAVVVASREFKRNDYSHERFVIADASLRLPASPASVALGMRAAIANNARQLHIS